MSGCSLAIGCVSYRLPGENNVFQCHDEGSAGPSSRGRSGGPGACGLVEIRTGYACLMQQLIETWRAAWSVEPNTTPASFPFGVVTLAGGTSEGFDNNMGAFRYCRHSEFVLTPRDRSLVFV